MRQNGQKLLLKNSKLCESFDKFSASERKQNLFKYLGLFARRDPIPEDYYEDSDESDIPELTTV